jgi:hypothetical protein
MTQFNSGQAAPTSPTPTTPTPPLRPAAPPQAPVQTPAAARAAPPEEAPPKIQAFEQRLGSVGRKHEETWKRSPNVTGQGAIHVKTFHGKLNNESLDFLDQQINEWLDAHPQYEVKLVSSNVGDWTGKTGREPNLIVQLWV